ncbi:RHS repeat domain-containing protein [candidate division CSSED10-310 bacterium]|uniref:RHS repeat domain-containing protein n=1 Tax=candidate division CSSED10-310 bacterium TaxID=2855610 RepID=A0ABV6YW06_UNCC1
MLLQYGYDSTGRIITATDNYGSITTINRDPDGVPTSIIGPYGDSVSLTMNQNGYISHITNLETETIALDYNQSCLLSTMTDARSNSWSLTFNALGHLIRDDDPAGGYVTLTRTGNNNHFTVTVETALGRLSSYEVEEISDDVTHYVNTSACGCAIDSTVDTDDNRNITYPDGTTVSIQTANDPRWGPLVKLPETIIITGGLTAQIATNRTITLADQNDPLSLTQQIDTVTINGRHYTSTYQSPTRTITDQTPEGRQMLTTLDENGRVSSIEIPGISPVNYSYDSRGRVETISQGANRTYIFTYDSHGNLDTVTDPLSQTVSFDYDLADRMTKQVLPDLREINVSYDANGNVKTIQPSGRPIHEFNYTPVNQQEDYIPPDIGIGPPQNHYVYSLDRQLIQVQRPDGKTIDLAYNATTGKLETITIPRGQINLTYYPSTGNVYTMTAPGSETLTLTYDGPLLTETSFSGSVSGSVSRTYNNNFQMTSQSVNGGNTISYQYDNDGLLNQAGDLVINRDPQNVMITGTTIGSITDNLSYVDTIYGQNFGEVASYEALYNTTSLYSTTYERDHLGRITKKTETIEGEIHIYEYFYYPTGWLHEVKKDGVTISTYTYDDNGNLLSYTPQSGPPNTGTYDNQDRLTSYGNATYTYTDNGELLTKTDNGQTTIYSYDVLGNLVSVTLPDGTLIEYVIDAANRRIGKKVNGTLVQGFLYDNMLQPIAELDGIGQIVSIFGPGYMIKGGNTYRLIRDHLGSIRLVVNKDTGVIAQRIDYDEFGNAILDTNPGFQPFGFAGGIYDTDTGLTRFGARDYDPEIGRWTCKDPILFMGGQTNLYGYVMNDPINIIDIFGLSSDCVWNAFKERFTHNWKLTHYAFFGWPPKIKRTLISFITAGAVADYIGGSTVIKAAMGIKANWDLVSTLGYGRVIFTEIGPIAPTFFANMIAVGAALESGIIIGTGIDAYLYAINKCFPPCN